MLTVGFYLCLGLLFSVGSSLPFLETRNGTTLHGHPAEIDGCGKSTVAYDSHDRIVGGRYAKPGEFPWMVSLREKDVFGFEHVCGAAILNENWIITAAHCFSSKSTRMYDVTVGLHKLSKLDIRKAKIHKLSKIFLHPHYDDRTFSNDIALLKTMRPIDIEGSNGLINGVCLPKRGSDPKGYATVSGWGHTKEDGENSDTLKTVQVPIIPREMCNEVYDEDPYDGIDEIIETMMCAGSKGRDSCQNDSGGPLVQYGKDGQATLIGVVSHGTGCGLKFYPGVYTRVSSYLDWMQEKIEA